MSFDKMRRIIAFQDRQISLHPQETYRKLFMAKQCSFVIGMEWNFHWMFVVVYVCLKLEKLKKTAYVEQVKSSMSDAVVKWN